MLKVLPIAEVPNMGLAADYVVISSKPLNAEYLERMLKILKYTLVCEGWCPNKVDKEFEYYVKKVL